MGRGPIRRHFAALIASAWGLHRRLRRVEVAGLVRLVSLLRQGAKVLQPLSVGVFVVLVSPLPHEN